jgi:cytochrome c oxidase assembly factor CtaG
MSARVFDRETLLDLLVNVIPLAILLFFIGLFLAYDPFGYETSIYTYLQIGIVAVTFVALAYLTYVSGKAISSDEKRREGEE